MAAVADPFTASDADVSPFADNYFEYDSQGRATKEVAQGLGCTVCMAGLGTFTYSYTSSTNPDGYNAWQVKTVETLPDFSTNTVYTNFAGQVMLKDFHDAATGLDTIDYWQYDDSGHLILHANPSAVTGYDETEPDLVHFVSGNAQYLSDNDGLIEITDYVPANNPGAGYASHAWVKHGELGTPILQETLTYTTHTSGTATVVEIASDTVYRDEDGSGAETTSYAYTWYDNSTRMASMTITYPVVATTQNGPGTADVETVLYDLYGRVTWTQDGDGYVTYTAYDMATGAVVQSITDVTTGLPDGWSVPSHTGLNLQTLDEVDGLGRVTRETDPRGFSTYVVYNDAQHEVRIYRGWDATTHTTTGPIEIDREYRPTSLAADGAKAVFDEVITSSATPTYDAVTNAPTGQETIDATHIQSLVRQITSNAGQVTETDRYFDLADLTYNAATTQLGTASQGGAAGNYYATTATYDQRGRPNSVVSPNGTITRTVYDGLGRAVSVWVGTDDSGATNADPDGPGGNANNMVKVADYVYDDGVVGDGNLTREIQYPDANPDHARVTDFAYDWRDRLVAVKSGVQATEDTDHPSPDLRLHPRQPRRGHHRRAVRRRRRDTEHLGPRSVPAPRRTVTAYDDQGRVYQVQQFSVDPGTGVVSTAALTTNFWYDHRGNLIAEADPGGLVTKDAYDGAGRSVALSLTDGAGGTTWAAAGTLDGDHVVSQVLTTYDADGNPILVTTRDRFHDDTSADTGPLGDASTGPRARVSYVSSYYDAGDRPIATVDVGTNGGAAFAAPSPTDTVPASSDTVLVTAYHYDAGGRVDRITDPRGIVTQTEYDAAGRPTRVIDAYDAAINGGLPTSQQQSDDRVYLRWPRTTF